MTHPFDWLRCPHCSRSLQREQACLRCPAGHSFDVARQGYVNLMNRAAPRNADTPEMLDARARFLAALAFAPLAGRIAEQAEGATRIVEVGAGTGYYLAQTLDTLPEARGLATDVSVAAAKRAARAHPRAAAVVADTWAGLPIADAAVDAVLCVFAPRNPAEFSRILVPGGSLVIAVPTERHLAQLRQRHGLLSVAEDKAEAVAALFPGWPARVQTEEYEVSLSPEQATDLIAMGPNAFHRQPEGVAAASVTVSVSVLSLERPAERQPSAPE